MTNLFLLRFMGPHEISSHTEFYTMLTGFSASINLMPVVSGLLSFFLAAVVIGAAAFGLYLLFAPADALVVMYQNYHLRRSMKPLKDEDFGSYSSIVRRMRTLGVVCILAGGALALFAAHSFGWPPE